MVWCAHATNASRGCSRPSERSATPEDRPSNDKDEKYGKAYRVREHIVDRGRPEESGPESHLDAHSSRYQRPEPVPVGTPRANVESRTTPKAFPISPHFRAQVVPGEGRSSSWPGRLADNGGWRQPRGDRDPRAFPCTRPRRERKLRRRWVGGWATLASASPPGATPREAGTVPAALSAQLAAAIRRPPPAWRRPAERARKRGQA